MPFMTAVASLFVCLLLLGLVATAVVFMVAPSLGPRMVRGVAVAAGFFIAGSVLYQIFRFSGQLAGALAYALARLVGLAAAVALIVCAFVYLFSPGEAMGLLKRIGLGLAGLLFLPAMVLELARAVNPAVAGVLLVAVSMVAYWVREYRLRPPIRPQKSGRAERKPILPRGGP
jgi:hypothetical protein